MLDEFQRIEPAVARGLYLDICALHQFGAPVRAGLISRASGVGFTQFQSDLFQPLENVVHVERDEHSRDVYYRSRHQHVAEIVFNRVLPAPEDKFDLLARVLKAINVDYSSDRETFSRLIRGRDIVEIFPSADIGRLFYDRVQEASPNDPFISHQRAVFEMQHPGGSLVLAKAAAERASELNPNNRSVRHTQGEIARRMANQTDDPLHKQAFRRITREKVGGIVSQLNVYDWYTKAQLAVDEFRELSASLDKPDDKLPPATFVSAVKEVETTIQQGLQLFPESSELLATEATFRELLDQTERAQRALEQAFSMNPRQDWLAVRLARTFQSSGDLMSSKRVLESCLNDNPSSKLAHFEMGRVLITSGDSNKAIEHLRRSFTQGDNRYEAQFWYARELFFQRRYNEASKYFSALHDKAPGRFKNRPTANFEKDGIPIVYECRVERKEVGYAFLKLSQLPHDVFASRAESDPAEWDRLHRGTEAKCSLAFTRRGVCAIAVRQVT